jgi:serine/threonine protein kinase
LAVFCSAEGDGLQFKIGDFGLSKLIRHVSDSSPKNRQQGFGRNNQHRDDRKHHRNLLLLENASINGQAKGSSPSNGSNGEPSWQDPLTEGIGTASYAAPEQVSTRSYGKEADIFSLGLMLLELVCIFSTEHERIQTFHDCRYRRKLPAAKHEQELFHEFPFLAQIILQCTDPNPAKRPTAQQLGNLNLMDTNRNRSFSNGSVDDGASGASDEPTLATAIVVGETEETMEGHQQEESDSKLVSVLKTQLAEKNEELKECQLVISEKDDMIADLRRQVHALQQQQHLQQQQTANHASTIRLGLSDVEAESFCTKPAASCSSNSSSSDEGGL